MRLVAVAAALMIGCGEEGTSVPEDTRPVVAEFSATLNRDLDVLFVVDDSGGTADMQAVFSLSFPAFLDRLAGSTPGGLPNLHVGLVTSDLGTATSTSAPAPPIGAINQGGCAGEGKAGVMRIGQAVGIEGNFLVDVATASGTRERNYPGQLVDVLRDVVRVGATGCGFEQPLASMRAALADNPANVGFRRDNAVLAILLLMDEDDCSAHDPALFGPDTIDNPQQSFRCTRFGVTCRDGGNTPDEMKVTGPKGQCAPNSDPDALVENITTFRDFLLELTRDPRRVVVADLIANVEPFVVEIRGVNGRQIPALQASCRSNGEIGGDPGVRLKAFAELFRHPSIGSICQTDYSAPLERFAQQIAFALGTPCVGATLADSDLVLDGLQPDCIVEDHVRDQTVAVPSCDSNEPPCWQLEPDPATCPLFDHLKLSITRDVPAHPATVTQLRCAAL